MHMQAFNKMRSTPTCHVTCVRPWHKQQELRTHPLLARCPMTASTAMYMVRALWLRALPPRAYLLTHSEPSSFRVLMSGRRDLGSWGSCGRQERMGRGHGGGGEWWRRVLVEWGNRVCGCVGGWGAFPMH